MATTAVSSAVLYMLSIVNDGIRLGDGSGDGAAFFGANLLTLSGNYWKLLFAHAAEGRVCMTASIVLAFVAMYFVVKEVVAACRGDH